MQNELSFILLVIAGVIFLILVIFAIWGQRSKRYQKMPEGIPELGKHDDLIDDDDVITQSPQNGEYRISSRVVEPSIDDSLIRTVDNRAKYAASGWVSKSKTTDFAGDSSLRS